VDVPECLECGACCFSELDRYVPVSGDDYARLGDRAEELTVFVENKAYLRMREGRCAALAIDGRGGRFVCTVYADRPRVCSDLARGSPACLGERDKADRPRRALALLGQ
jgi:Fe-S-cluster containining protein